MNIQTTFTKLTGAKYPIIAGPMFLVSDENLVIAACKSGIVGGFPTLNWRTDEKLKSALKKISTEAKGLPFAANIIANKSNIRADTDLKACLDAGVPIFVTSLGSPKKVIEEAHKNGAKVFCDVTTLDYAKKVEDLGADGVIAVCSGAGGHAGPTSPFVLIPYLRKHLSIPVVAAGGIATGNAIVASLALGASAVQIGTRFIASKECKVDQAYKDAIINANPEDIVLTRKISGTPAAVIKTPYIEKLGTDLNFIEKFLLENKTSLKKWSKLIYNLKGSKMLEAAAKTTTWKQVWSAGQGVGMIDSILSVDEIVQKLVKEMEETYKELPRI
jgi:nitronate monooxygenase